MLMTRTVGLLSPRGGCRTDTKGESGQGRRSTLTEEKTRKGKQGTNRLTKKKKKRKEEQRENLVQLRSQPEQERSCGQSVVSKMEEE